MTSKAPGTMRRYSFAEPKVTKSDFDYHAADNGFAVEVVKVKRDGWNDGREFYVVKDGVRTKVEEVTKGQSPRWNEMVDHVVGRKRAWCAGAA